MNYKVGTSVGDIVGSTVGIAVVIGAGVSVGFGVGVVVGIGTGVVESTSRSWMASTSSILFFESYVPTAKILFPTKEDRLKPTGISRVTASVDVVIK